ncbi:MAG: hypothetical protein DMD79_09030, partial [Candidatus Rokuibacteriota bacterium]
DGDASKELLGTPEIREALAGRYGARTRISPGRRRSVTLYSALPVWDDGRVVGAVQVSQSTARLFRALDQTRLGIFQVFLASVAVAVGPSAGSAPSRMRSSTGAGGSAGGSAAPGDGTRSASWRGRWRS